MADSKITALTAISTVDPTADPLVIVDVSDTSMAASGTTKKSTINQILGAGGTATLASATITGDLTVDTSTLKVDSTNNRVGVVTATPRVSLDVASGDIYSSGQITWGGSSPTANQGFLSFTGGNAVIGSTGATALLLYTNGVERYNIGSTGICTWSNVGGVAGTAMTLNANGLGIGVTPSAWSGNYRVLEIGRSGNAFWGQTGVNGVFMSSNALLNSGGSFVYSNTAASTYYTQNTGRHEWYNAPSGTAGNPITFTQAMTLDASGNLSLQSDKYLGWGNLDSLIYGSSTSNYIYFRTNATERVRVKGGGQLRFVPLAADPAGAEAGDVYYNSSSNKLKCYNGTTWNDLF